MSTALTGRGRGAPRAPSWTDEEKETVRRLYPVSIDECAAALPGRTREAVVRYAALLDVHHRPKHWDDLERAQLRRLWDFGLSLRRIADRLGRTEWAVFEMARELGLPLGVPQGCEYFTDACERTGFHGRTLWAILKWAEVVTTATRVRPDRLQKRRRYYVDPDDVDEAIKRWLATETVDAAARRHGMSGTGLRYWLKQAGVLTPRGPSSSKHHRIESAVIDRVVAERRAQKKAA